MEFWESLKDIVPEGDNYLISIEGKICSTKNNKSKLLKLKLEKNGYYYVTLSSKGKTKKYAIHRLVALTFIPNINNLPIVHHKDENKLNNHVDNLEWQSHTYNLTYNDVRKKAIDKRRKEKTLNEKEILKIDKNGNVVKIYKSASEGARENRISKTQICRVANKKYGFKTAGGYKWEWLENYGGELPNG